MVNSQLYEKNFAVLSARFPEIAGQIQSAQIDNKEVTVTESIDGPVVSIGGLCLDHQNKPKSAAMNWAKQELRDARFTNCDEIIVLDFAFAYHLEALLNLTQKKVSAVALNAGLLKLALENRDVSGVLERLSNLFLVDNVKFSENAEFVVRPQMQVIAGDVVAKIRSSFYGTRGLKSLHPKFGVLGPIRGGTLPIMTYTANALKSMGERVNVIDMHNFDSGFQEIDKLIFNNRLQNIAQGKFVETLSDIILQVILEKPIDILICMACSPITAKTLAELRRRGIITVYWFVEDYTRFLTWEVLAPYFDFIFTIQRGECIEAIKKAGCPNVYYLPTACDPFIHCPIALSEEEKARWGSPISFVGAGYHNRQQAFASLANMPFKIWGTEWPTCTPFDRLVQEEGRRLTPEEYVKIFNATKININLHSSTERDGVDPYGDFLNPRTFELAACGGFQLVDHRSLLPEAFTPGEDIVTFKDIPELKAKIDYFLHHEDERLAYIAKSRETVLKRHTYQHRMREMLTIIYSHCYEDLKRRYEQSPWHKVLERTKQLKDQELYQRCLAAFRRGEEAGLDGLVGNIVTGKGSLTETEQKLLFLFHISKQVIRMNVNGKEE